jgi:hypothetical protein
VSGFVAGPGGNNPNFAAGNTAGPATIQATWTDGGVNKSQTFSYTISTTASVVNCTPPNGTIAPSSTVACIFTPGSAASGLVWSRPGFVAQGGSATAPTFTAGTTNGPASVSAQWLDGGAARSQTFSFTITQVASVATCNPSGGTITAGGTVTCTFTAGNGYGSDLIWDSPTGSFSPASSNAPSVTLTAGSTAGPAQIRARFSDAQNPAGTSVVFSYTIAAIASVASCSPTGGDIAGGSVVNCTFTPGTGYGGNISWTATSFTPVGPINTVSPSFTAATTFGPATIKATWSDAGGSHSVSFGYDITNYSSAVVCTPPSGTNLTPAAQVTCQFTAGAAYLPGTLAWSASNFNPTTSTNGTQIFTAVTAAGLATITATWNDGTGPKTQTFSYTVVVSTAVCSPNGGALYTGTAVVCQFTSAPGATFNGWSTSSFGPATSIAAGQAFVAGNPVPSATIIGSWTDAGGAHSTSFSYSIIPAPAPPLLPKTSITASSALGKTHNPSSFTVGTKVATIVPGTNNVVTIRFHMAPSMAGKHVRVFQAARICASNGGGTVHCSPSRTYGGWTSFVLYTSRAVDSNGDAWMYVSSTSAQWLSFYASFPGDAQQGPGTSQTQQVRWK